MTDPIMPNLSEDYLAEIVDLHQHPDDPMAAMARELLAHLRASQAAPAPSADLQAAEERGARHAIEFARIQASALAEMAIHGLPENSRQREAMEASLTRFADILSATLFVHAPPQPAAPSAELRSAARDVLAERARQIAEEGWSATRDDIYENGELADAASCYAVSVPIHANGRSFPDAWPWGGEWWKPTDRRRDLVKAGALILAEIERIDRDTQRSAMTDRQLRDQIVGGDAE